MRIQTESMVKIDVKSHKHMIMKKLLFLITLPLAMVACMGNSNSDAKDWEDKAKEFANDVADKSVELYNEAAPVVEQAAKDAADKSVELYNEAAPVVEQAAKDAADKSVELYNDLSK